MKKSKVISVAILSLFLCVTVASAYVVEHFYFNEVGQYDEVVESLQGGTAHLNATYGDSNIDATLGLSLSKKGLFGYSFISRCNPSTKGATARDCYWGYQDKGTYKGTVVFNSSNDGKTISGTFYLRNN